MERITIILDERKNRKPYYECAEVIMEKDGEKKNRVVEIKSLLSAFKKSAIELPKCVRIGKVPVGFYDGAILKESEHLSAEVLIVLPKSRQVMQYENTRYDVHVPSLVFYFSISKSKIFHTKIFALKDERPNEESQLYVYPFGNVDVYGGSVCWGSNCLKDIQCLKDLEGVIALFLQSECNSDHYRNLESNKLDIPLRGLFEKLKEQDHFLDEWLMPCKNESGVKTLGELVKQLEKKSYSK